MEPTPKSQRVTDMLERFGGRTSAITQLRCVNPPIGCGRQVREEELPGWPMDTQRDYRITGLCWACQRKLYDERDNVCTCSTPCCEVDVGVGPLMTCGGQHCPVHGMNYEPGDVEDGDEPGPGYWEAGDY